MGNLSILCQVNYYKKQVSRYNKFFEKLLAIQSDTKVSSYEKIVKYEELINEFKVEIEEIQQ